MAKKIAIVTDSNSGITQKQAAEMGIHVHRQNFTNGLPREQTSLQASLHPIR